MQSMMAIIAITGASFMPGSKHTLSCPTCVLHGVPDSCWRSSRPSLTHCTATAAACESYILASRFKVPAVVVLCCECDSARTRRRAVCTVWRYPQLVSCVWVLDVVDASHQGFLMGARSRKSLLTHTFDQSTSLKTAQQKGCQTKTQLSHHTPCTLCRLILASPDLVAIRHLVEPEALLGPNFEISKRTCRIGPGRVPGEQGRARARWERALCAACGGVPRGDARTWPISTVLS